MLPPKPKPRNWVHEYDAMRVLPFKELHEAVDRLKASLHDGEPITVRPLKSKREYFPGFPVDDDNPSDGRDLCLALDEAVRRRGTPRSDVRPDRPDPPVMREGNGPDYPAPEDFVRLLKARRLTIQPNIQPSIATSLWPDDCGDVAETRLCPTTIRGVTIKGLEWGNVDIDDQTRLNGLVLEMQRVGNDTFQLQDMLRCHKGTNSGLALSAMHQRIGSAVAKRMPDSMQFKIGITWNPPYRWANPKYGYMHDGYDHMEILAWDFRGCMIGLMESALIIHCQKEHPRLCLNVKKGDDNLQDISPQFLYVAYLP